MFGLARRSTVALNSNRNLPFLTYLTLFQSRIGVINLVLPLTSTAALASIALTRKIDRILKGKVDVDIEAQPQVVSYLRQKKFLTKRIDSAGRYPAYTLREEDGNLCVLNAESRVLRELSVYCVDVWMADERVRSVVSVPTPKNITEVLNLNYSLGTISNQTNSWTASGQFAVKVRTSAFGSELNPFVLGPELVIILRQLIEKDGLMLGAILADLSETKVLTLQRDSFSRRLPNIAGVALGYAKTLGYPPETMREGKAFVKLIEETGKNRAKMSSAPGVLEHRITPRLEWLTDTGALSKDGVAKNGFAYHVTGDSYILQRAIKAWMSNALSAEDAALMYWQESKACADLRELYSCDSPRVAILSAYATLKRNIGSVSIRDICLLAGMALRDRAWRMPELEQALMDIAKDDKRINLSGGRYKREAEFVHIRDELLVGINP